MNLKIYLLPLLLLMTCSLIASKSVGTSPCTWTVEILTECRDNGTPCDMTDDYYQVRALVDYDMGQSYVIRWGGGAFVGPYPYASLPIWVGDFAADRSGPILCFDVMDRHDTCCQVQVCTDPLLPCSDTLISLTVQRWECNDNRTANDDGDDFYNVYFFGSSPAGGWPHQFEIVAGGSVFSAYDYNKVYSIQLPADGTWPSLEINDLYDQFCTNRRTIGPLDPCSEPCEMDAQVIDYICDDNGTPDPADDLYRVTIMANATTPSMANRYTVTGPGLPPLPREFGNIYQLVVPAQGQYLTLVFDDIYYLDCRQEIEIGPLDPCSVFCKTEIDSLTWICDNKGTPDPGDDEYKVTMVVTDTAGGSGYEVQILNKLYGPFEYGEVECITLPADGSEPRLNFKDIDFPKFCYTFEIIGPLEPCSYPCDLSINSLLPVCNDNGTPTVGDDFYEITFNVDYLQATPQDSFTVEMGGSIFGAFPYNEDRTITWPADGGTYEMIFRDVVLELYCEVRDTIGPLEPCSSVCDLDIQFSNITCDNNRTGLDPSDDLFFFDLTVNGTNVSASWMADDPAMTTAGYGSTVNLGPFLISSGNVTLTISDVLDGFCRETIEIPAPGTCSDSCFIEVLDYEIGDCNDNNTGPNRSDDFFFLDLLVDGQNTSANGTYFVFLGGMQFGPYMYGTQEAVGPLPANGTQLNLTIRDADTGYCEDYLQVSQQPCSDCSDTANAGSDKLITCQDNEVTLDGSASAPGSYTWVGPNNRQFNGPNPSVGEPGTYILTVTFDKGCTGMDTVIVRRDVDLPIGDPGPDADLTCIVDSVIIGGPQSSTGPNIVYEWRDQNNTLIATSQYVTIGTPGTYCLKVIDTMLNCESAINCVTIGENRSEPSGNILVSPNDAFDCRVDSIELSLGNSMNSTFYWRKRAVNYNTNTLWVTDTGIVSVIVTDTINGCTKTLSILIRSLVDFPVISIIKPDTITCLEPEVTIDGRNSQTGPTIFYQWYDGNAQPIAGANGRTLTVNAPGEYLFQALDTVTGCINIDTISVGENRFYHVADAGIDKIIKCDSTTVILNAGGSTVKNNISYSWRGLGIGGIVKGNGTLFPEVDGKGYYELTVRDDITGCESLDTVFVDRVFPPMIDFVSVKGERCGGDESGQINLAGLSGVRPLTYELNGRPVTETKFDSLKPGLFFFRVTDSLGCYTDTLLEVKEGNYLNYDIKGDTFILRGDSTVLEVVTDLPDDQVDQVYWSEDGSVFCFRCYRIVVKPDSTTTYNFRLIDINGCEIEFDFVVKVQDDNDIFVPNIFTPNEDTENEVLHVFGKHLVRIDRMMVFNRWGELLFLGNNLPPGPVWDGKWNGEYHVPAVLTYVIDAVFENGERKQFTGDFTLLR